MKYLLLIALALLAGCTKLTIPVSGDKEIVYEKGWIEASAKKVDFWYEDPNVTVYIVVNDPNSSINPGRFRIVEPRSGIEVVGETK